MGRLIDADALIKELHHMIVGDADFEEDYAYMGIDDCIRSMPTAYDVEKVVAELKKAYPINPYPNDFSNGRDMAIGRAIDIVRKGGALRPSQTNSRLK